MGFIVDGKVVEVPGLVVRSWLDDPSLRLRIPGDGAPRDTHWVRSVCLHTTKGWPDTLRDPRQQKVLPGAGNAGSAAGTVHYWANDSTHAGAHVVVDFDGSFVCCADLLSEKSYHAKTLNDVSIGVEIYQGSKAEMYEVQLEKVVEFCDWATKFFGIQRQVHLPYQGPIDRLGLGKGDDAVGVFGHRDQTSDRGPGDPGDAIMQRLVAAGYESFDFANNEDRSAWSARQQQLGTAVDGIPGPGTVKALIAAGKPSGMWVARPGD